MGWIAAGIALASAAAVAVGLRLWGRRVRRWRARRALVGERDAERLLAGLGFAIVERQPRRWWTIGVGGEPTQVELRADLLVRKWGRRYVAEVKTGELVARIEHAATRRQLLEYSVAYEVDGVLLVDMERGEVVGVDFGLRPPLPWAAFIAVAAAAAAATWWLVGT